MLKYETTYESGIYFLRVYEVLRGQPETLIDELKDVNIIALEARAKKLYPLKQARRKVER